MFNENLTYSVRMAVTSEYDKIGKLLMKAFGRLDGFPKPVEQPGYYNILRNVGELTRQPETTLWVAVSDKQQIAGAVIFFADVKYSGAGGRCTTELETAGFRLLAVDSFFRGQGIGKLLAQFCIQKSRELGRLQIIIHSTESMKTARKIYEDLGFLRSPDLDFMQGDLLVYGFRLIL
jgi:GNAT superfamily N-acetyltransferase